MIILSLGINRWIDGLTLTLHDEILGSDPKLTEARKHRDEISRNLSCFESNRNSLYLTQSKFSIHWITSAQLRCGRNMNEDRDMRTPYFDKPHCHTTPSKSTIGQNFTKSSFVIIALCQHVKKNNCEQTIFKVLDKCDKDFENKYNAIKVAQAKTNFQYADFTENLRKLKSRYQNQNSSLRSMDKNMIASFATTPIIEIREEVVLRLAIMHQTNLARSGSANLKSVINNNSNIDRSNSIGNASAASYRKHHVPMPESSKQHNLKATPNFYSNNDYYLCNQPDSAIGSSINSSTKNDYTIYADDRSVCEKLFLSPPAILKNAGTRRTKSTNSVLTSGAFNDMTLSYYSEIGFTEPVNSYGYIALMLVIICGALNVARAWHIWTLGSDNVWEDLEDFTTFFISAILCIIQARLILLPADFLMKAIGRTELNWGVMIFLVVCHLKVADYRQFGASLFHVVAAIGCAGVVHVCRSINDKTTREMA